MVARHWLYFGGFVVTAIAIVGAGLMGVFEGLSVLSGGVPGSEELAVLTMLSAAAEWIVIVLVLGLIALVFLTAAIVSILRNASLPRDDRLVTLVTELERHFPLLRRFDVSAVVEPTTEDRKRELREQYVTGEISESTFEQKLAELMDETPSERGTQAESQVSVTTEDRSRK
ncbi:SHOCT domain-containing protein [Saliphagus infecundisoli]|uniref:SHOCT domain-containing protein n=1 Tax=Saliphagus infecundisoli TaxID=1849069 RepID=A0ABD5QC38_9EURY|nr:SHOCT domain-containing protein [Saliphagus infecundisoli]